MSTAETTTNIRLEIQKIKNLPPLPVIAQQLVGALNDPETSIDEIANIVKNDPTLTSRILGLANSAFFGFNRKVYTLNEAIINVLGLDLVRGLALTIVMGGMFDMRKCPEFDISRHWSSALLTADLAMRTSTMLKQNQDINHHNLFLYGLLHNFGILILVDRFPKIMTEIFNVAKRHMERRLIHTEQAILDMDHHQAGAWLAQKWQLPEDIVQVIQHHHYADYRGDHWRAALITGYCSRATRAWIMDQDELLPDESDVLKVLEIHPEKMKKVADKCRERMEETRNIAEQMAA